MVFSPGLLRAARSANERIVVGVMGLNGRGKALATVLAGQPDVDVAYLCDVDERVIGPAAEVVSKGQQHHPKPVSDFRRILEDRAVDGLVIATPDHWHALATIHGCAAGKHVLVEKPCSHNVLEGERMVAAARRYNRLVQVDTQRRSSQSMQAMVEFLARGGVGKLHFARSWITSRRENIGRAVDEPTPPGVDYELWLGPAPARQFNRNHFHYRWHWFWEYGTGELGNVEVPLGGGNFGVCIHRTSVAHRNPHAPRRWRETKPTAFGASEASGPRRWLPSHSRAAGHGARVTPMSTSRTLASLLTVAVLTVPALSGCSSDDSAKGGDGSTTTATTAATL